MAATVEWLVWLEDSVHLKDGDDRAGYHYSQAAVHCTVYGQAVGLPQPWPPYFRHSWQVF